MRNTITMQHNQQNLSERLLYALKYRKMSQASLARLVGIKPQAIHYLCHNTARTSRFAHEIALALQINASWLSHGTGMMLSEDEPLARIARNQKLVPVLEPCELQKTITQNPDYHDAREWVPANSDASEHSFAFQIQDNALYPRFDRGTLIILDPDRAPKNADFILMFLADTGDFVFGKYVVRKSCVTLEPMNTRLYKTIEKKAEDIIVGVIIEARWQISS